MHLLLLFDKCWAWVYKQSNLKMQKFQDLLTEAAQLKEQQLKQQRKNFEALPEYLKSGLNYAKKYVQLREQDYLIQQFICEKIKSEGNFEFKKQRYNEALSKYQEALSIFRFISAKKYENLKDEDISYENYGSVPEKQKEDHELLLVALYLNICSCLTKLNKKDEAIHSAEQALKVKETAKAFYKKAQAYIQYINKDSSDIKLGFYYLNKAYQLSKDESIVAEMHRVKASIEVERKKEKEWFKFMFDKNKETNQCKEEVKADCQSQSQGEVPGSLKSERASQKQNEGKDFFEQARAASLRERLESETQQRTRSKTKTQFEEQLKLAESKAQSREKQTGKQGSTEAEKNARTKDQLNRFLEMPEQSWLVEFQEEFIHKHGSKVYSVLQLYNYNEYLPEFKALLAKCLQLRQKRDSKHLQQKGEVYGKWVDWLRMHPVEQYRKYIERYDSQMSWIESHRGAKTCSAISSDLKLRSLKQDKQESDRHQLPKPRSLIDTAEQVQTNVPEVAERVLQDNASAHSFAEYTASDQCSEKQSRKDQIGNSSSQQKALSHGTQYLKVFILTVVILVGLRLLF